MYVGGTVCVYEYICVTDSISCNKNRYPKGATPYCVCVCVCVCVLKVVAKRL